MLARGVHARIAPVVATPLVCLTLVLTVLGGPAAAAAPPAPTGLAPATSDVVDATPVLSWDRVPDATGYEVEVSTRDDFATKIGATISTVNRRATPTTQLPMSDLYWRVRAKDGNGTSAWAAAQFSRSRLAGPTLLGPPDGDLLDQPSEPAVLRWDPVPGAIGYNVELDRGPDADWVDTITGTTKSTTYTVKAMASGDWAWRVTAVLAVGQVSYPSSSRTFVLGDLTGVTVTSPADGQDLEDVVLDWDPVPGALHYEIRVSTDDEFGTSNIVDARTVKGTRYSPVKTYNVDDYWWQVRAIDPLGVATPWGAVPIHSFTRTWDPLATTAGHGADPNPAPDPEGAPRLLYPADTLSPAVTGDLYLQWTPVRHATSYRLDVGTDAAFSPGTFKTCFTPHTTYVPSTATQGQCVPGLNTALYWRVKALDDPAGVQGYYSPIRRFVYSREQVHLTAPADHATVDVPTLAWDPVAGAERYAVTVIARTGAEYTKSTFSTSWTVQDELDPLDGPFEWSVRAIGHDNVTTPASILGGSRTFSLTGDDPTAAAAPLAPLDQDAGPTARFPSLSWAPLPGAASYRLWVGTAGTGTFGQVDGDFAYPAGTDASSKRIAAGSYDWFVQALDEDDHLIGTGVLGSFTVSDLPVVTGQQVALGGTSLDSGGTCSYSLLDAPARTCPAIPGTPVLDWQPDADTAYYLVYVSRDRNFQNMVYGSYSDSTTLPWTGSTRWVNVATLPESQAGTAYYWYVRPCKAAGVCAPDPLQANHAFEKRSPQVVTDPVTETADDITFSWQDYLATNEAVAPHPVTGERPGQEARTYQLQVSLTNSFDRIVDDVEVDQPTYTAFSKLYPEGNLYWRVRAYDGDDRNLPWSDTRTLVKASPRPAPIAPTGTVATTEALRWTTTPFAVAYDVEVYQQADTTASSINRVVDEQVSVAALAPLTPLPSGMDYVWRVRQVDDSDNPGAWSDWGSYRLQGVAPTLELPAAGAATPTADTLFTWHAVPGAATYKLERREPGTGTVRETVSTSALAWAPTSKIAAGAWQWRVTALDAGGAVVLSSAWRDVTVQGGPVATAAPVVTGSGTVGELLHATEPTWDLPDVVTTYQWLRNGAPISGASDVDYEVIAADVGKSISVRATGTRAGYDPTVATSNAITGVLGPTASAVTPPVLDGTGQVGTTLVGTLPTWDQPLVTTSYRWLRDGAAAGSSSLSYAVRDSDLGKTIVLEVTGRKTGYLDAVVTSAPVVVSAGAAVAPTIAPTLTGTAKVGQRLTAHAGTWGSGIRFTYQWLRSGSPITGATSNAYTPVAADATRALSVAVTGTRTGYESGTVTTAAVTVARMTSTTKISLPATVTPRSGHRAKVRATVTVLVSGWSSPTGRVRVLDGKRVIARGTLRANGTVKVTLKGLRTGNHRLVATYDGTTAAARSRSAVRALRVL